MMRKFLTFSLSILMSTSLFASVDVAEGIYKKSRGNVRVFPEIAEQLMSEDLYFTAVPFVKEYLASSKKIDNKKIDDLIDRMVQRVGVRQFEVLPIKVLSKSNAPMIKYILAKKLFRLGKYKKALTTLNASIPKDHPIKPFALMLEASALSIQKKYKSSVNSYQQCVQVSNNQISRSSNSVEKRQLEINRDECVVGIPRAQFAAGGFDSANLNYLDLDKTSHIWPEILFEEAWNSFYQRDFNRSLGKLVTYKAPLLQYVFNPEIDVLRALTFMELCLWNDTKKAVDEFYQKFEKGVVGTSRLLKKHGRDYKYYYLLAQTILEGKSSTNDLFNTIVKSITRDAAYQEMYSSFQAGRTELERLDEFKGRGFRAILKKNARESLFLQRDLIGAYVRKGILLSESQVRSALTHMSYIKLEVLSRRKNELYNISSEGARGRGDIKNLVRTDKQYFWSFNGEFWADELGDYVFSLKSECK